MKERTYQIGLRVSEESFFKIKTIGEKNQISMGEVARRLIEKILVNLSPGSNPPQHEFINIVESEGILIDGTAIYSLESLLDYLLNRCQ